jgi:uncharacterized membrane protein YeaQ/YmgE (transglycosylase-associated protein family)
MDDLISWVLFGLVAGWIARVLHPGRDPGGCVMTVLLGVGGALVGGYIGTRIGWGEVNGWSWRSMGLAVLGSLLLLIAFRVLFGRSRR